MPNQPAQPEPFIVAAAPLTPALAAGRADTEGDLRRRLAQAEGRLDRLMRGWPGVIVNQRPDFGVEFASPNIQGLTGLSSSEWLAQPRRFWQVVHELDAAELQAQCKRAAQTGEEVVTTFRLRHAATGRVAYVLEHRQPIFDADGSLSGYEAIWLDVTRQTIAEKRLSTAAWKETLAVLTLGMAHDFKNVLSGIYSLSDLAQIEPGHPFYEGLTLIQRSSLQANQLVNRMISLHTGQAGERNYHNLNEIAGDLIELIRKILPRRVSLASELASVELPVYLDVVEFRQVVINLLLNAADAMPRGGKLSVRTSRHERLPDGEVFKSAPPRLPCVCLTIEDTGCGIKARHLSSIFDPFFTTKSKGSGLGLYNARISIEKHRGAITVHSQEGVGSQFQIWLPEANFEESSQTGSAAEETRFTRRTILLLGQAGEMLDKTAEFLRSHNFHVVAASAIDSIGELLQSGEYRFAGIMVLVEPNDPAAGARLSEVHQLKKELKVALKLSGCNQDDLGGDLLNGVDLLLNPDSPDADMLVRLVSLFE